MSYIDYSKEPRSDIAFVDMKSFYASIECVERGLHPLHTSLCVMSRADKIINFLPDFKVKKIHENGLHKKIVRDNIALTLFIKMYFKYHMSEI